MEYTVREAGINDFFKLQPLHKEVHDLHAEARPDKYKEAEETLDQTYYEELISSPEAKIFTIEEQGEIVAFTILKKTWPPNWNTKVQAPVVFMEDLGVKGSYRRKGLARLLFEKAVEFTKECGAGSLELGVWEFNRSAIDFYQKMGMTTQARKMEMKID
ncbi:GNAT family N-acetyltransferase [Rossellomorea vietnamensis]|uniref:GNAT family N-acetyltransferase n=1 Tax=Rossellomorea vietnamensis TaxID=218284 RepID=A0A5D4KJJ0_9BACI|nr:GNAT family N-acetyltransferase [Rossellomorea vietnamensis]TYR77348.1 GNAT family N-acetyltransferase [Rossellomorea vietnamensis]